MNHQPDETIAALIAQVNALLAEGAGPEIVGPLLQRLKQLSKHGSCIHNLRRIATFRAVKRDSAVSQAAQRWIKRGQRAALKPSRAAGPVTRQQIGLCQQFLAIDAQPEPLRSRLLEAKAHDLNLSLPTLLGKLRKAKAQGPDGLARRRRRDRGRCREPEEVQGFFRDRRINKATRHEPVQLSIDATRREFPDLRISADALRRLDRGIGRPLTMSKEERRRRYLPSGQWEVAHPNHTWVLDCTVADLFVWDGDPDEKPYRPHLTAIIDECTQSCMWAIYTKETPSTAVLQGVLLHAILPKSDPDWPQCGFPRYLHCDNGKVQTSHWLRQVCAACHTKLDLMGEIRHAGIRSPWQDGHIESFFGIAHRRFEGQLGACYCGNDPKRRPDCFADPEGKGPRVWQQYPTLDILNEGFRIWISADYHHGMKHSRLKMSRARYWDLHADGYVAVVPEAYLRYELMQRDQRNVVGPRVSIFNRAYRHEDLIAYDGMRLEVRWDPADLTKVGVVSPSGAVIVAAREPVGSVDDPKDLSALKGWRRRSKAKLEAIDTAARVLAGGTEADRRTFEERLTKHRERQPIRFTGRRPQVLKPKQEEQPDATEALDLIRGAGQRGVAMAERV